MSKKKQLLKELDYYKSKSKTLEESLKLANSENQELRANRDKISGLLVPVQLYHCKKRKTTYLKVLNGKFVKVKLHPGDKDSINTALAYCVMKSVLSNRDIDNLCKQVIEIKPGDNLNNL